MRLRRAPDGLLARSPLQLLARRRAAGRLTVLAYHAVPGEHAASFERHLEHLCAGYSPVSLGHVLDHLHGDSPLPRWPLLVTFDDGDRSLLEVAAPRLAARRLPAVAFVVSGLLDGDRPPWWREVEDLVAAGGHCAGLVAGPGAATRLVARLKRRADDERRQAVERLRSTARRPPPSRPQLAANELNGLRELGVEIGSHTHSHPCLDRCDPSTVEREIGEAHRVLSAILGRPPCSFAYPNGDHTPLAERVLARHGYRAAFLFDHRASPLPPPHPLRISRIRVNASTPPDRFRILVSGLHPLIHHALGRR